MRNFLNNNYYFRQKGQALVELATFGTVLLFCLAMLINFGLQANYQQELEMKAFRQAMRQSYNNDNRGPNAGSDVNLIKDKPGITAQDPYGVSERYPFGAGAKVTWNVDLMDEYVDESNNLRDGSASPKDYRPKVGYEVNGQVLGPYTAADFVNYPCDGAITVRIPLLDPKAGKYWKDVTINCATQTKVLKDELSKDEPKPLVGYIRNDAEFPSEEKEQISSVLINGRQKTVVKVEWEDKDKDGEVNDPIKSFWVLDSQAGQIDTAIEIPTNPDGSKDLAAYANIRQGLWPNYTKTITKTGTLSKTEDKTGITTTTSASSIENIRRWIRLNIIGPPSPVNSEGLSNERNITWTTLK